MNNYERLLQEFADEGGGSAVAARITWKGKDLFRGCAGYANVSEGRKASLDDVYRIYSMTKMLEGIAALKLFEEGYFQLDDPISKFIPAFKDTKILSYQNSDTPEIRQSTKQVTFRHLFTMTAGFAYPGIASKSETPRKFLDAGQMSAKVFKEIRDEAARGIVPTTLSVAERIATIPMCFEPGEGWNYGLCADILGALVTVISGKSLGEFIDENICKPLGMVDTTFHPNDSQLKRIAQIYNCADPKNVVELDFSNPVSAISGSATKDLEICCGGICSTLDDYSKFMQMIAGKGTYNGVKVLGRKTVELMAQDHLTPLQREWFTKTWYPQGFASWGLMGRVQLTMNQSRLMLFPGSFGWAGAAGTIACADPNENMSITFMTQRIPSTSYACMTKLMQVAYSEID